MFINKLRYSFEKAWNEERYWKYRSYIQVSRSGLCKLILIYLRHVEVPKCCTTGLGLKDDCCIIKSPLILHHGLDGIAFAPNVDIGHSVTIFQYVTICKDDSFHL